MLRYVTLHDMTWHHIHTYAYLYCIHISQNERICIYIHTYCIYIYCIYVDRYQRGSTIEGLGDRPSSLTEVRPAVLAWYLQVLYTLTDLPTGFLIVNQHKRRKLMVNLALKHWDISKCVYMYTIYTYYIYIICIYIYTYDINHAYINRSSKILQQKRTSTE